jgi:hypothetical protein
MPTKAIVEVTTSVHQNDYLKRQRLHQEGVAFGVKGLSRDKKTGAIVSEPYVEGAGAVAADLAAQILDRIKSKSAILLARASVDRQLRSGRRTV